MLDEAIEGCWHSASSWLARLPGILPGSGPSAGDGQSPATASGSVPWSQLLSSCSDLKGGGSYQRPVAGIQHRLLHLPLLPAGSRIAELGLKQVVAYHGLEALVDLAVLAAARPCPQRSSCCRRCHAPGCHRRRRMRGSGHRTASRGTGSGRPA